MDNTYEAASEIRYALNEIAGQIGVSLSNTVGEVDLKLLTEPLAFSYGSYQDLLAATGLPPLICAILLLATYVRELRKED